jgi:hypothetical protein
MEMKKTKILVVLGAILLSTTLVSAALLPYFGKVETTLDVQQSIVIGDANGWYNWDKPVIRDLGDVVHCKDYCYKLLIKNQACEDATAVITDKPTGILDIEGIDITHYIFGDSQTVHLAQKVVDFQVSPWALLPDGDKADVTFNTCGPTMDYTIVYSGLDEGTSYSLIYYGNMPDYWTEGPVTVLGSFTADSTGTTSGSAQAPTIPFAEDENALRPISEEGETYAHQYGAKVWIVPTAALIVDGGTDVDWGQASAFLFETDLVLYIDCDNWSPVCLSNVYPLFDTTILKAESTYCWISCYHVDFDIVPGTYTFDTILDADPITPPVEV